MLVLIDFFNEIIRIETKKEVNKLGSGQKRNKALVEKAERGLYQFKYDVANELGIQPPQSDYWGNLTSRDCGAVGGNMVRKMVEAYENQLSQQNQQGQ